MFLCSGLALPVSGEEAAFFSFEGFDEDVSWGVTDEADWEDAETFADSFFEEDDLPEEDGEAVIAEEAVTEDPDALSEWLFEEPATEADPGAAAEQEALPEAEHGIPLVIIRIAEQDLSQDEKGNWKRNRICSAW